MIQTIGRRFLGAIRFIKMGVMAAVLFVGINERAQGQVSCPAPISSGGVNLRFIKLGCAPVPIYVFGDFTLRFSPTCTANPNNVLFDVYWGDGSSTLNITPQPGSIQLFDSDVTGDYYSYEFNASGNPDPRFSHTFPISIKECLFVITVNIKDAITGRVIMTANYNMGNYHQTDNYSGANPLVMVEPLTGQTVFLVCVGQEACIKFQDVSELNCNPAEAVLFDKNADPRYLQFIYGVGTGGTGVIPGITVAGVPTTDASGNLLVNRKDGGDGMGNNTVRTINNPGPSTGVLTNQICVPGTTTMADVGKEFHVTLQLWNKCNPWNGNATNPNYDDVQTEAIIRIVAAPPAPDPWSQVYCNRTNNTYTDNQYLVSLTHNPGIMGPGTYYYFRDNGSGTGPNTTDLNQAIHKAYNNKATFNPVTLFSSGQDRLDPTVAQTKIYWVVYEFTNGQDIYNVLCTSAPSKITYTIREDISTQPGIPTGKTAVCPQEVVRFTVNGNDPSSLPIGGAITYVWDTGTNYTIVATENGDNKTGRWADIRFTGNPTAPATQTVGIKLYRRWASAVGLTPSTCSASKDCQYCASAIRTLNITVNPNPTATLAGGGTICAGEKLPLTVSGFKGAPGTTSYDIVLTNGETLNGFTGSSATILADPPGDGASTTYQITSLKANPSGCIAGPLGSQVVNERKALTLTGSITGNDPVCAGSSNVYTLPVGAATTQPPIPESTEYYWTYNGASYNGPANSRTLAAGAATNNTTPAVRNIDVVWRYTTPANKSSLADPYCSTPPLTKPITVRPAPTAKVATPSRTICLGSGTAIDVTLTGTPNIAWEVSWRVGSLAVQTTTVTGTASGTVTTSIPVPQTYIASLTPGTYNFTLTAVSQQTAGGCSGTLSSPTTAPIKILRQPTAVISGNKDLCEGNDWDVPISMTGEGTGTYRVTYTVNGVAQSPVNFTSPTGVLHIPQALITQTNGAITTVAVTLVEEQTIALDNTNVTCSNAAPSSYTITTFTNPMQATISNPGDAQCITIPPSITTSALGGNNPSPYTGTWSIAVGPAGGGTFANASDNNTTFTVTQNGRYELQWTINASSPVCPPSSTRVVFDYAKQPNQATAGLDQNWCYDLASPTPYQLGGNAPDLTIETGEWTLKSGPGTANITNPTNNITTVTVSAYGKYVFTWRLYNICGSTEDDVEITFVEVPKITPIPTQQWCAEALSDMPAFSASPAGSTIIWAFVGSAMPGFNASGTNPFTNQITPANPTVVPVQYNDVRVTADNNGCKSTQDVQIYLKPRPKLAPVSPTSVCAGTTVTFQLNPFMGQTVTYDWLNDEPSIGLAANGPVTVATPPYTYSFTTINGSNAPVTAGITNLTATVNGCTSDPVNVNLTVNPIPVLTMPAPDICPEDLVLPGETTVMSNVSGTTYIWNYGGSPIGLPSAFGTGDNVGEFTAIVNETSNLTGGTVTITGTANGCSATGTYNLQVRPRPVVNAIADQSLCPTPAGAASGAAGGTFAGITFTSPNLTTGVTYNWEKIPPAGANATGTTNPVPATQLTFGDNTTSGNVETYTWTVVGIGDATSPAKGCQSRPVTFYLNVNPRPQTILTPPNQTVCSGNFFQNITFYDNANGISTFGWTINDPGNITGAAITSGTGTSISFPNPTSNTSASATATATVTATSLAGCVGPPTISNLTVSQAPVMNVPSPIEACSNELVTPAPFSTSNGVTPTNYSWSISDPSVAQNLPASATVVSVMDPFTTTINNSTTNMQATVTVTANLSGCNSAPVTFPVTVRPVPKVNGVSSQTVCPGNAVTIPQFSTNLTGNDASVVSWTLDNPGISTSLTVPGPSGIGNIAPFAAAPNTSGAPNVGNFVLTANMSYTVSSGTLVCSGPTTNFAITVNPTPDIAQQSDLEYCNGDIVPSIVFSSTSSSATFSWSQMPASGISIGLSNPTGTGSLPGFTATNNTSQMLQAGESTFSVTSTAGGCPSSPMNFKITVKPVPQLATYPDVNVCGDTPVNPPAFALSNPAYPPPPATAHTPGYTWSVIAGNAAKLHLPASGTGNLPAFTPDTILGDNPLISTIRVTPSLAGCPGISKDVYIQLNPTPTTTLIAEGDNCIGKSGLKFYIADNGVNTSAGSKYYWGIENPTPPPPAAQPVFYNQNDTLYQSVVQVQYPANPFDWSGTLTVIEENSYHCRGPKTTLAIKVVPVPEVFAGLPREVCFGDTVILSGQLLKGNPANMQYEWFPGTDIIANGATLHPTVQPQGTGGMRLTAVDVVNNCRSNPSTVMITVLQSPLAPMVPNLALCESDPLLKMKSYGASDVMHWERLVETSPGVFSPIAITNSTDSTSLSMKLQAIHPNALPSYPIQWGALTMDTVILYQVYQTRVIGTLNCKSPVSPTQLTIRRNPAAPISHAFTYCENPTYPLYTLSATSASANAPIINWYDNTMAVVGSGENFSVFQPGTSPETAGSPPTYTPFTYYASTSTGYCSSPFTPVPLTIYPNPALTYNLTDVNGNPTTGGCSPFLLNATNTSTNTYADYEWVWAPGDTLTTTAGATEQHTYQVAGTVPEAVRLQLIGVSTVNKNSETGVFCRSFKEQTLIISPGVKARFIPSATEGCDPLAVFFTASGVSVGAYNFRWYWNETVAPPNGQTPNNTPGNPYYGEIGPNPQHIFENKTGTAPVNYHVWLQVDNGACYDNKDTIVSVYPVPNAAFTHNLTTGSVCPPAPVIFTNNSSGAANNANTRYAWNFADGSVDTTTIAQSPITHYYENWITPAPVSYKVDMTAYNQYTLPSGNILVCNATASQYFLVNPQVQAKFTGDSTGCAPALARFQSQSLGAISAYQWNWGDGTALGTGSNPSHTYAALPPTNVDKNYRVLLTAKNSWCSDTVSRPFHLYPTPTSSFAVDKISGCQPLAVTFTNTSNNTAYPNPATGMTYIYDYRDGYADSLTTTAQVTHTFINTLGTNLSMTPTLTAKNIWGCSSTFSLGITIYPYVKAEFSMEDSIGCSALTTKFYNASQGYSSYQYSYGDGSTASGTRTSGVLSSHIFTNNSMYRDTTYYVTMSVTTGQCSDAITRPVKVLSRPTADFRPGSPYPADYTYPAPPIQIDNLIPLPDRDHLTYLWSWNEQGSGYVNNFSISEYPSPLRITDWGSFDITQRVTAPNGICFDSKTLTINIVPPAAMANFEDVPPACMPYEVKFVNTSRYGKAYRWDFGDGVTSNEFEPTHMFTDAGTYKVTLTVTGDNMFPSTITKFVVVHPLPHADFQVMPNFLWVGQALKAFDYTAHQLTNGTPYDIWYRWDWGDNTPKDTVENPLHMYLKAGSYSITLTVGTYTNPQCISTLTKANVVDLENAGDIILPNAFIPRAAGEPDNTITDRGYKNYLFYPPVLSPTRKYHFIVMNRWGQLLFETTDPTKGWNGYFKGRLCDEGVYIYKIEGVFETGQSFSKMGDITLLR